MSEAEIFRMYRSPVFVHDKVFPRVRIEKRELRANEMFH